MNIHEVSARRVARLRELMDQRGYDAVVLRNNADLRWLTAASRVFDFESAHTAYISQDGLWLHTDSRYFNTFKERLGSDTPWNIDMDTVSHGRFAALHAQEEKARVVAIEDSATLGFYDELHSVAQQISTAFLTPRLHGDIAQLRIVKDAEEIELMQKAQDITDAAFDYICGYLKPGLTEQQVRAELENYMLMNGADALSFDSIIASGPNGANPHAMPGERVLQKGDMIVMDYGAGYRDYHSDMTRTVCLGSPSPEQKKVYDIVRKAHETCAQTAKPGCIGADIHRLAASIIEEAGYGDYFKHGLGHGVGLEIHEMPNFSLSWEKPIEEGAVVTIEPGIYLPGNFGVRLEDFGVMKKDGYEPFTHSTHELVCID